MTFCLLLNVISFPCRTLLPEIHSLFNGKPLQYLTATLFRNYIVEDGVVYWMSKEIEDYIASGYNWGHDQGSVHVTGLEALFKVQQWMRDYKADLKGKPVCSS